MKRLLPGRGVALRVLGCRITLPRILSSLAKAAAPKRASTERHLLGPGRIALGRILVGWMGIAGRPDVHYKGQRSMLQATTSIECHLNLIALLEDRRCKQLKFKLKA